MKTFTALSALIFLTALLSEKAVAQWSTTPDTDNYLNAQKENPTNHFSACTDGSGGAYYTYVKNNSGGAPHVYVNRVNKNGVVKWGNGIELNTSASQQFNPAICEDGKGGCYVAYEDNFVIAGNPVLVQHFDSLGNKLWAGNGIIPFTIAGALSQSAVSLANNNGNGVFVTAQNTVFGGADGIQTQKVNFNGALQWGAAGSRIILPAYERNPKSVADGNGGLLIVWFSNYQLRAQRVNSSGVRQYDTANYFLNGTGSSLSGAYNYQLIRDSVNRYTIVWSADFVDGTGSNIYAQRININGVKLWTGGGVIICDTTGIQAAPNVLSDNNGGAYISWCDSRDANTGFYAQRVNSSGTKQWQKQGFPVYTGGAAYAQNFLVPDINNGAKLFWNATAGGHHIRMQSFNLNGSINAPAEGITTSSTMGVVMPAYNAVVAVPNGEAIVIMEKYSGLYDLYAKKVPQGCNTAPVIKTITTGCTSATLSWAGHLFSTFELRYQVSGAASWTTIGNVGRVTTYTINNLLLNTSYKFQIRTKCDLNNSYSGWKSKSKATQNCFAATATDIAAAGINEMESNAMTIYPNPAGKSCIVKFTATGNGFLKLFDASGNLKYKSPVTTKQQQQAVDVSALTPGIYICRIETGSKVFTQKLVVAR